MRKSKKNKRNRYKRTINYDNEDNAFVNFTPQFREQDSKDNNIIDDNDNAAPNINILNSNKNVINEDEDLAPAMDMQTNDFNNYISSFNKRREGMTEIPINNPINNNKNKKTKSFKFMRKVYKKQLLLNMVHENCFILLEIKSKLLKMISQQFYADDEDNQRLYISIYNFDKNFIENEFKPGKYIIIKEPFYKEYLDGKIGIRVDNPNNVILFKNKVEAQNYITQELGNIDEYLKIGDEYFEKKEYYDAIDIYLCCSELNYNDLNIKSIIYKKLINSYLKINANILALKYCDDYLLLYDRTNRDIIGYKIKALINCKKFEEAQKFLEENVKILTSELYKINEKLIKNNIDNTHGKFNLNEIKGGDVSDYLNPKITFGFHKNTGNKLIAKDNISKGELLIVSKAFYLLTNEEYLKELKEYYIHNNYKRYKEYYFDKMAEFSVEPEFYLYQNLKEQKKISEDDFEKLLDLDDYDNWNIKYTERAKKYPNKQTPHLPNIANINGIKIYSSIFSCESQGYGYGLWYYPSFINHNCNPNTLEFGINDIYFLYAQKDIKKGEEITRRYFNYGLDITRRYANFSGYGFVCKCEVCSHQLNFILEKNKEKYQNVVKELDNLYEENISDKALYKSIKNIENILSKNGLEYNIYDLITFYFRAGYLLLNRKIYYEDCEKYLNKAYILIEGKNFHFECIILHYLYILYYEKSNKDKLKTIEDKINKNLNEFFGNTFLKDKLLDIYKERKNIQLLKELNKKVKYIEDIENNKIINKVKRLMKKFPFMNHLLILLTAIFIFFLIDKFMDKI